MNDAQGQYTLMYSTGDFSVTVTGNADSAQEVSDLLRAFLAGCTFTEHTVEQILGEAP